MSLPYPPFKLSKASIEELHKILHAEIGTVAYNKLSQEEVHHLGCLFLFLLKTHLEIAKEESESLDF